jgi:sugar phosphate isomerase/epimerase
MTYPKLSISACTTYTASFAEDLAAYSAAGAEGIGLWEHKLPKGQDDRTLAALGKSNLRATLCVPQVPSVVPDFLFPEPRDAVSRRRELCAAIRRLAAFDPVGILVLTGDPGDDAANTRRTTVEGLRAAAEVAGEVGVTLGLEPLRRTAGTLVTTLPETITLIEEIGAPNIGILCDTWHFWDLPGVLDQLRAHADRIIGVQVNDWRDPPRSWADRVLPGDGVMDLPSILGTLESAGYKGWYDVEVFSDNGVFGNSYPDSLWNVEAGELARRAVNGFRAVWDKRKVAMTSREAPPA